MPNPRKLKRTRSGSFGRFRRVAMTMQEAPTLGRRWVRRILKLLAAKGLAAVTNSFPSRTGPQNERFAHRPPSPLSEGR